MHGADHSAQARAKTFGGQVLKKKKRAPIAKIITELLAAVPCPSAFLLFFWHYAANFVKEINECCG